MFRYKYFIISNNYVCIRVPEHEAHNDYFLKYLESSDWSIPIHYHYNPSKDEEIFKLKQYFKANNWNDEFTIKTHDEYEKEKLV